MRKFNVEELKNIIAGHTVWLLTNGEQGERADLRRANLIGADLSNADLRRANLSNANLIRANLIGANLSNADLRRANLSNADLRSANLSYADLRSADLRNTCLIDAGHLDARYDELTAMYALACPSKGGFIGYKKAGNMIVELYIPPEAKRSSATTRKCRCNFAKVLAITTIDGEECGVTEIASDYDSKFIYRVGEYVEVSNFCEDRWLECAPGIHFFITREEAIWY